MWRSGDSLWALVLSSSVAPEVKRGAFSLGRKHLDPLSQLAGLLIIVLLVIWFLPYNKGAIEVVVVIVMRKSLLMSPRLALS